MKIAFIISAYKLPEQLTRLVSRLNDEGASFFIHVDRRTADPIHHQMVSSLRNLRNITWLERHRCDWGGFGHVAATLKGIRATISSAVSCDYVVLLTGQDYPIKSMEEIKSFFLSNNGKQFINHFPLPTSYWDDGGLDRIECWHLHRWNRHLRFPYRRGFLMRRKFPRGLVPYGGSSYWCLTKSCVEFINQFIEERKDFVQFFKTVSVPDELFFQTILMNSSFKEEVINDDLRYIDWKDNDSGSPGVLDRHDFTSIIQSSMLFARKFDPTVDPVVLDMIDCQLLKRT